MKKYPYYLFRSLLGWMSPELVATLLIVISGIMGKWPFIGWVLEFVFMFILIKIIAPRVSNNTIYERTNGSLHMDILFFWRYWRIDYFEENDKIRELLKQEFIQGLKKIARKAKGKKIKVSTHKWVYDNVMCSPEVQKLYRVDIVCLGDGKRTNPYIITATVLSLMSPWYIWRNRDKAKAFAMKKRLGYTLELIPLESVKA